MTPSFVYSNRYDIDFHFLKHLHPFDGCKFSKAWSNLTREYEITAEKQWIEPENQVSDQQLLKIHSQDYLESLNTSTVIAKIVEISFAKWLPNRLLQSNLLDPMKLACQGTLLATETAIKNKSIAMNFAGGYHHAFSDHGEGFCFFADAALSIFESRERKLLSPQDKVLMIDLDAHQGNGFEAVTQNDENVHIFDMYNFQIYPGLHPGEPDEFPYMIPLKTGINGDRYLEILEKELASFLETHKDAALIFYNAGTDILAGDPLGGLSVVYQDVVRRDKFVLDRIHGLNIPTVIMTSGGYTRKSHELIAEMAGYLMEKSTATSLVRAC